MSQEERIYELEAALLKINGILSVPAAEYVPAIRVAWVVIEDALRKQERCLPARIAELERQVVQLSADRDRLIQCVLKNEARKALKDLLEYLEYILESRRTMKMTALTDAARKALADTEHEVRK